MSSFRRIAAACALVAVLAMGLAAPVAAGGRRDDSATSASSLDTALVAASARRARVRGGATDIDGQPSGHRAGPRTLFHPLWLTAAPPFPPPAAASPAARAPSASRTRAAPLLASRTSRGPPPAFVTL